jgi:hypothetical protein
MAKVSTQKFPLSFKIGLKRGLLGLLHNPGSGG